MNDIHVIKNMRIDHLLQLRQYHDGFRMWFAVGGLTGVWRTRGGGVLVSAYQHGNDIRVYRAMDFDREGGRQRAAQLADERHAEKMREWEHYNGSDDGTWYDYEGATW